MAETRRRPGSVRDAIVDVLRDAEDGASVKEIVRAVGSRLNGALSPSSVRSYLQLKTPEMFVREAHGRYRLGVDSMFHLDSNASFQISQSPSDGGPPRRMTIIEPASRAPAFKFGRCEFYRGDCMEWIRHRRERTVHAVVTDPPYGLVEYTDKEQAKLRRGKGGVWRIPPSFDGCRRSPVPRFTTLTSAQLQRLTEFFREWGTALRRVLVPGAHVFVASNPLVSYAVADALVKTGLERRGEIIRLVMTLRGGDRPKNAHREFPDLTVMPRSMWEPWLLFREPLEGRVKDNLRKWKAGALRRPTADQPFGDVLESSPTHAKERAMAPHPSLKPQAFLRRIVRAALPFGEGVVLDPFAGAGSTLAACERIGCKSIGVELDARYVEIAKDAIPRLTGYEVSKR